MCADGGYQPVVTDPFMSRSSRRFIRFLLFCALVLGFSFLLREWFGGISMDGFSLLRIKGREVSDESFVGRRVPLYYSRLGDGESRLPPVVDCGGRGPSGNLAW